MRRLNFVSTTIGSIVTWRVGVELAPKSVASSRRMKA
jgi:hypothetical protein